MSRHVSVKTIRLYFPTKQLALFAIGGFSTLSMAPSNFWPAIFFGLSALYIMVTRASSPLKAGAFAFAFALGYFGFSLSWTGNALLVENNPYRWAWPFAISGLPILLSFFPALAVIAYKRISLHYIKRENTALNYLLFCILLSLTDYARGNLFTGFPWNLYACTWIDILPIAQLAALADIYLLNIMTIFWAVAPAFILSSKANKTRKSIYTLLIITTFGASYNYGQNRIDNYLNSSINSSKSTSNNVQVTVVQPNIKQSDKWKLEKRAQNFIDIVEMSKYRPENDLGLDTTIILWPETAISQDILNIDWSMDKLRDMLSGYPRNVLLISGALRYTGKEQSTQYFNSIIAFDKNGTIIDTYDKQHLVPFGEYIPLDNYINIAPIVGFSGFVKGNTSNLRTIPIEHKNPQKPTIKYIALICYEVIFPHHIQQAIPQNPDLIINVTNDAWYGNSAEPYQHLVQAQFRAIESGLPLIRSSNTGISAIIDPIGNIVTSIDLMKKGVLLEKLALDH